MESTESAKIGSSINYYVIGIIAFTLLVYTVGNALEPDVDSELDFFEATLVMGFAAAAIFAFIITKRYWGSKLLERADVDAIQKTGLIDVGIAESMVNADHIVNCPFRSIPVMETLVFIFKKC